MKLKKFLIISLIIFLILFGLYRFFRIDHDEMTLSAISLNWSLPLPKSAMVVAHESNTGFTGDGVKYTVLKFKREEAEVSIFGRRSKNPIPSEDKIMANDIYKRFFKKNFPFDDMAYVGTLSKDEYDLMIIFYDPAEDNYIIFEYFL